MCEHVTDGWNPAIGATGLRVIDKTLRGVVDALVSSHDKFFGLEGQGLHVGNDVALDA